MVRREMESGSEYGVGSRQADAFGSLDFRDSDFLRISSFGFTVWSVCGLFSSYGHGILPDIF